MRAARAERRLHAILIGLSILACLTTPTTARQIYHNSISDQHGEAVPHRKLLIDGSLAHTEPQTETVPTTEPLIMQPMADPPQLVNTSGSTITATPLNTTLTERVVNGMAAPQGRFPYVGFLRSRACPPSPLVGDCGSTLIMPRVSLTSRHCVFECSKKWEGLPGETQNNYGYVYTYGAATVKLNRWDISNMNEAGAEERSVVQVVGHELYKRDNSIDIPSENDVTLLKLNEASKVAPVKLHDSGVYNAGTEFQVAGWGSTNTAGTQFPSIIRFASVPFVSMGTCRAVLNYNVWAGNVCAGGAANKADTCIGDSGGPMVLNGKSDPSQHRQVGITSYGATCGAAPAVYVNVPLQRGWIDNMILLNNMLGYKEPLIKTTFRKQHRYLASNMRQRFKIYSAGECSLTCKADGTCRTWSYDYSNKKCYLMNGPVERMVVNAPFTSGNITGNLAPGTSECQYDLYSRYTMARSLANYTAGYPSTGAGACCGTCKLKKDCQGMSYDSVNEVCRLWAGASYYNGWGRKAWQYGWTSAIVARR